MASYKDFQNSLESGWAIYFDLNNLRGSGSFYPADVDKFKKLLAEAKWPQNEFILARSGVEYKYYRDSGFTRISGTFPRAMIIYQAKAFPDQDQVIKLWSNPDFPADQLLLVEAEPGKMSPGSGLMGSESANIIEYQNEKVVVEAEAKKDGWFLLLDSYYPGWKAEVDGNPVEIFRADGFFRAVKIPAGKHRIAFNYFPVIFKNSLWVSGLGFLAWLGLIIFAYVRPTERERSI